MRGQRFDRDHPTLIPLFSGSDVPHGAVPAPPVVQAALMKFHDHDDFGDSADTARLEDAESALLSHAGAWSKRNGEKGFVPDSQVPLLIRGDGHQAAAGLVRAGLWRRVEGARPGYQFVNWRQRWDGAAQAPQAPPVQAAAGAPPPPVRRPAAPKRPRQVVYRDKALRDALRARDGDRCRFCTVTVRWGAGRAPDSGTWELIDMDGEMSPANIVTACMGCAMPRRRGAVLALAANEGVKARDASPFFRDASGSVTAGVPAAQKRHGNRHSRGHLIDQSQSSAGVSQSEVKSKSRARDGRDASELRRDASPADKRHGRRDASCDASRPTPFSEDEATEAIIDEFLKAHGRMVTREQALHAKGVIDQRAARKGTVIGAPDYYRTAVRKEADITKLLPPDGADQSLHEILTHEDWAVIRGEEPAQPKCDFEFDYRDSSGVNFCKKCGLKQRNSRHDKPEVKTA